ncbi:MULTISPECIES: hypothetical protein [Kitasatospora]|uniref:Transposase n=1 Tax=Kitasatospora cystarginea TaxID=58350 RepID=A0ABP5RUT4_9ACTN
MNSADKVRYAAKKARSHAGEAPRGTVGDRPAAKRNSGRRDDLNLSVGEIAAQHVVRVVRIENVELPPGD